MSIVTLAEGDITHLHVGLKGTMNALFLKDLADKTRRGLRGRVELGKSGGGPCYGYKVTHATHDGAVGTGDRDIVPAEAEVIRRIFRDYAAGLSPKAIAKRPNAERCSGPGAAPWNPSTIHGNPPPRHRDPEQRTVHRATRVESRAIRQGSGHGEACFATDTGL